jgi:hypothetical protein
MPVIGGAGQSETTTVGQIVAAASQDVRNALGTTSPVLIDYTNRVVQQMLRVARWKWLLSSPQRFVTRQGCTDYWVGPTGQAPVGVFDTGLNLTDLDIVDADSVYDRTNKRRLYRTDSPPLSQKFTFSDNSSRPGQPRFWSNDPDTPEELNLFPAPNNQNLFAPTPETPLLGYEPGGSIAATRYYVTVTFVDSNGGESSSSEEGIIVVPAGYLLTVQVAQPVFLYTATGVAYTSYNVYVSTASGDETKQNGSVPIMLTQIWTMPTSGIVAGSSAPVNSTLEPMNGYLIEFRYYATRLTLTNTAQVIQVPDYYKDTVVAGVNWLAYTFLTKQESAQAWQQIFQAGITSIIRDTNLFPRGAEFIAPDPTSVPPFLPAGIETYDEAAFPTTFSG